jgi:hypothetical protein
LSYVFGSNAGYVGLPFIAGLINRRYCSYRCVLKKL